MLNINDLYNLFEFYQENKFASIFPRWKNKKEEEFVVKPTCTIKPITKIIARQETMSAWFCMTNSWLNIGGFLLELLRPFTATILVQASVLTARQARHNRQQSQSTGRFIVRTKPLQATCTASHVAPATKTSSRTRRPTPN